MNIIPTKLNVFAMQFDVDTPQFIKEAAENCNGGIYAVCWNIFRNLLAEVSVRATELNDPILNVLMLRLNLYDLDDGSGRNISKDPHARNEIIKKIEQQIKEQVSIYYTF